MNQLYRQARQFVDFDYPIVCIYIIAQIASNRCLSGGLRLCKNINCIKITSCRKLTNILIYTTYLSDTVGLCIDVGILSSPGLRLGVWDGYCSLQQALSIL